MQAHATSGSQRDIADSPAKPETHARPSGSIRADLFRLQRQAGNRATQVMVNKIRPLVVQRDPQVDHALQTREPADVKDIENINAATETQKIQLIEILLQQRWVGPSDESKVEEIWGSFGDQLGRVMSANADLWQRCLDRGAELEDLPAVRTLRSQFGRDVGALANQYLYSNQTFVIQEMSRLGISAQEDSAQEPMTADQSRYVEDLARAGELVAQLQQGREDLRRVRVGHNVRPPTGEFDMGGTYPVLFDPFSRPDFPPDHGEAGYRPWDEVKAADEDARALISVVTDRYPALYAVSREGRSQVTGQFAAASPGEARAQLSQALRRLIGDIKGTQSKLNAGDLDPLDLLPLHAQLFAGTGAASGVRWGDRLPRWAAEYERKDHQDSEFWARLGLESLAAAAFLLAPFTGGASMLVMMVGVGAAATQAKISADRYEAMAQAARTSVQSGTELVTPEQVSAADLQAQADAIALAIAAITVAAGVVASGVAGLRALRGRAPSLRTLMGPQRYAEYEQAINAIKAKNPTLTKIPTDDLIAIRGYTDNDWAKLNAALRTQNVQELARLQAQIRGATSGLRQLPSYQGQVTRTVSYDASQVAQYRPGTVVTERGFTSATTGGGVAQREGNTLMVIQSRTGKDVALIARHAEQEVLFMPGTRFQVTEVQPVRGANIIHMVEVP